MKASPALSDNIRWPDDNLSDFLQKAEEALKSAINDPAYSTLYEFLSVTNEYLRRFCETDMELHPKASFTREMLLRARGAYFGAARLSLSGQLPEAYMVARGVIEPGLFSYIVHCSPELEAVWRERHMSTDHVKACRNKFSAQKAFEKINRSGIRDTTLVSDLNNLYDDLIDYSGHPNVNAVTPHLREHKYVESVEGDTAVVVTHGSVVFITNNLPNVHRCVRSVVKSGIGVLRLYQIMAPDVTIKIDLAEQIALATEALWREEIHPTLPVRR